MFSRVLLLRKTLKFPRDLFPVVGLSKVQNPREKIKRFLIESQIMEKSAFSPPSLRLQRTLTNSKWSLSSRFWSWQNWSNPLGLNLSLKVLIWQYKWMDLILNHLISIGFLVTKINQIKTIHTSIDCSEVFCDKKL